MRQLPLVSGLGWLTCALGLASLLVAPPAEAGRRRGADPRLALACSAPFGGLGYVNESVDTATGDQEVILSCGGGDFTAVSDAQLTGNGELADPDAPFDYYLFTRLTPTASGRAVTHLHTGVLPRGPRLDPVYQQTAATHVFSVPVSPIAGVREVLIRITEVLQGTEAASDLSVFGTVDVMRVSPSSGLGDCDPACSFQDVTGTFPLTLEGGATYLLDSNVSSSYSDLGPANPEEPAFVRSVTVDVRLGGGG